MPDVTDAHRAELAVLGAESRRVPGRDGELHVLDYAGDRPPLLVLPGITSPAITWDFVVTELRDLVRPLVLDHRGRGLSEPGAGYKATDFAADAAAAIRALGLERPLVLGHSLGARVGAALAASGEVELGGVTLIDPPLCGPDRGSYPTSREAFLEQLHEGYAGTTGDAVRRFYPKWSRAELLLRARWVATCAEDAVLATYDEFTREDFFDWWPDVEAPAAFIRGGDSPVVTEAGAAEAARANPAATQHCIAGAGHMVPWDQPAPFLAELRSILHDHLAVRSAAPTARH
jgi:N-formylmaleamate deformylase